MAAYIKDMEEGSALSVRLLTLALAGKSIPSLAVESPSLGFQHILKTSLDIQSCGLSNYCILELSIGRQTLLD